MIVRKNRDSAGLGHTDTLFHLEPNRSKKPILDYKETLPTKHNFFYNKTEYSLSVQTEYTMFVPSSIEVFFITGSAGGGGGSGCFLTDEMINSGSGGSSGESISKTLVNVHEGDKITITVGRGGKGRGCGANGENGFDTAVRKNDILILTMKGGRGGLCATATSMALGGSNDSSIITIFSGDNGENGDFAVGSLPNPSGGKGGKSFYGQSGNGATSFSNNGCGYPGTFGSGGGGAAPYGSCGSSFGGRGGHGFVSIEW